LLVAVDANGQVLAVRYEQIGADTSGAVLLERMGAGLFSFPIHAIVSDELDQVLHVTRSAQHIPTSYHTSRAMRFGGHHAE
jgi:hypothetical protein